eukprot:82019_1
MALISDRNYLIMMIMFTMHIIRHHTNIHITHSPSANDMTKTDVSDAETLTLPQSCNILMYIHIQILQQLMIYNMQSNPTTPINNKKKTSNKKKKKGKQQTPHTQLITK